MRPCPRTECRYSLAGDGRESRRGRPSGGERDTSETCALDLAERGPQSLVTIGRLFGLSRERIRQIEDTAIRKLGAVPVLADAHG